jgi:cell division protein FtsL
VGFALFASLVVGGIVFGIVVLNVLLAQAAFRLEAAQRAVSELSQEHVELVREQATLSAPGRIAAWAIRRGMRLPDDIRILHAPGEGQADPAGADPSSGTSPSDSARSDGGEVPGT